MPSAKTTFLGLAALCLLAPAIPAAAEHGTACREDARRLCPEASGPQRLPCLESHKDKVSAACRAGLARMHAAGEEFRKDCREDPAKLCPGAEGRALLACLEGSLERLTPSCAQRVRKIQAERRVRKERIPAACRQDLEELCLQAAAAPSGLLDCLTGDTARLGAACRKALLPPAQVKP